MTTTGLIECLLRAHLLLMVQALIHFGGYEMCFRILGTAIVWVVLELWLIHKEKRR